MKLYYVAIIVLFTSCIKNNEYEHSYSIKNSSWKITDTAYFDLQVPDSNARYNVYVTLRRSINYPYANLWLNILTLAPDTNHIMSSDVELTLEEKTGKPTGNRIGDNVEHLILIKDHGKMKKGIYKFWISQKMRDFKLPEVLNIGMRIEKVDNAH